MVDSNDRERVGEARDELMRMLAEDELRDAVLLIFANKQVRKSDNLIKMEPMAYFLKYCPQEIGAKFDDISYNPPPGGRGSL